MVDDKPALLSLVALRSPSCDANGIPGIAIRYH
jgi:hypothetical protein